MNNNQMIINVKNPVVLTFLCELLNDEPKMADILCKDYGFERTEAYKIIDEVEFEVFAKEEPKPVRKYNESEVAFLATCWLISFGILFVYLMENEKNGYWFITYLIGGTFASIVIISVIWVTITETFKFVFKKIKG